MYPEPHVPVDHELRRAVFIAMGLLVVVFWAAVAAFAISAATARPAACDGYTAQECAAAVEAM